MLLRNTPLGSQMYVNNSSDILKAKQLLPYLKIHTKNELLVAALVRKHEMFPPQPSHSPSFTKKTCLSLQEYSVSDAC